MTLDDLSKQAGESITRSGGPWAWLAVGLVAALLVAISYVGRLLIPAFRDYVTASAATIQSNAASIDKLTKSEELSARTHADLVESLIAAQKGITDNGENIRGVQEAIDQIAALLEDAKKTMANVPQQRETQNKLLQQIDDGIQALTQEVKRQQKPEVTSPGNGT